MDYVKFIYRPLVARAARQGLVGRNRERQSPERGRFPRADVDGLLKTAWGYYAERVGDVPMEPTVGSKMNVRLACFTISFFNAALAAGVERAYAIELVADAAWRVYRLWSMIALGLARLTLEKTTSLAFAVTKHGEPEGRVSLSFPFNAPGYLIEPVPSDGGTAFDVVRCPVADYFRREGAVDLCFASWCNLDYALAETTREKLVRTKTLVRGDDRCDFRLKLEIDTLGASEDRRRTGG
jgi:L-2-amino-thiazoline-4-carboxylic acid hydrolase